jgi:hypothetical protein
MSLAERIAKLPPEDRAEWQRPAYAYAFAYMVTKKFGAMKDPGYFIGLSEQALFNCVKRFTTAQTLSAVRAGEEVLLTAQEIEQLKYLITDTIDKWDQDPHEVDALGIAGGRAWIMVQYLGSLLPRRGLQDSY